MNKEYNFEYTDEKIALLLFGISLAAFIGLLFCIPYLVPVIGKIPNGLLLIGVPFAIFWFNRKRIKKEGSAIIDENSLKINLEKGPEEILFSDLKSYKIQHHNGTRLNLKFNVRNKIILTANSNFCNSAFFEAFCDDLEKVISQYIKHNHSEIVRSPSIFEQKWMEVFLIVATVIIIGIFLQAFYVGKAPSTSIYSSVAIFIGLWVAYFKTKQKIRIEFWKINIEVSLITKCHRVAGAVTLLQRKIHRQIILNPDFLTTYFAWLPFSAHSFYNT